MLSYRHEAHGAAAVGDPQGAGAGALLAAAAARRVRRGDPGGAHANTGLQSAPERDRMGRHAPRGSGAGDAGFSPAGAATLPQGPRDSLPGRGERVANRTRAEGRTTPRRDGAGSGPAAALGSPRRPPALLSALRGVVLAGAQARVLPALLPVGHGPQQGPPGEGEGGAGPDAGVTRCKRARPYRSPNTTAHVTRRYVGRGRVYQWLPGQDSNLQPS